MPGRPHRSHKTYGTGYRPRADPLRATVGILIGDLMVMAHELRDAARADSAGGATPFPVLATFLKTVRKMERRAALDQKLGDGSAEARPAAPRPGEKLQN